MFHMFKHSIRYTQNIPTHIQILGYPIDQPMGVHHNFPAQWSIMCLHPSYPLCYIDMLIPILQIRSLGF